MDVSMLKGEGKRHEHKVQCSNSQASLDAELTLFAFYCRFWDTKSVFSPEERVRSHKKMEEQKNRDKVKE